MKNLIKMFAFLTLIASLTLTCNSVFANQPKDTENIEFEKVIREFTLCGFSDETIDKSKFKAKYGEPKNVVNLGCGEEEWVYDGIQYIFSDESISTVIVTSPKYPTYRGIKVGDSIELVKKLYPEAVDTPNEHEFIYEKSAKAEDENGEFSVIFHLKFKYNANHLITEIWRSAESI